MEFGKIIAIKRKSLNLTQSQLGNIIGVSSKLVSKWECGISLPDYSVLSKLCKTLDIDLNKLFNIK